MFWRSSSAPASAANPQRLPEFTPGLEAQIENSVFEFPSLFLLHY